MTEKNTIYSNSTKVNNGVATLIVDEELSAGVYTIIGNYPENDNYQEGEGVGTLNITSFSTQCTLLITNETIELGNSTTLTITVTTNENNIVNNGTITIYEDDTPIIFNQNLNENGVCTIEYTPTSSATHQIYARYNGVAGVYDGCGSNVITINVIKTPILEILKPTMLFSGEPSQFYGRITYNGQPVTDGEVGFQIGTTLLKDENGMSIILKPDNEGYVSVTTNAPARQDTSTTVLKLRYRGTTTEYTNTDISKAITHYGAEYPITPTVIWESEETTEPMTNGNYHIQATITRPDEYPIQGATVSITITAPDRTSQQTSNLTTDTNGEIDLPCPIDLIEGEYTITLIVNGTTINGNQIEETTSNFTVTVDGVTTIEPTTCAYYSMPTQGIIGDTQNMNITSGVELLTTRDTDLNQIGSLTNPYGIVLDFNLTENEYSKISPYNIPIILYQIECEDEETGNLYQLIYTYDTMEGISQLEILTEDGITYTFENALEFIYKSYDTFNGGYYFGVILSYANLNDTGEFEFPESAIPTTAAIVIISDDGRQLLFDNSLELSDTWWVYNHV